MSEDRVVTPDENRWFPGQRANPRFEFGGWRLATGERWDAEAFEDVDLAGFHLDATRALVLDFRIEAHNSRRLEFPEVGDLQVEGSFDFGKTPLGWEVMGTQMLVGDHERDDGRLVYVLELSNALLCFASRPGA